MGKCIRWYHYCQLSNQVLNIAIGVQKFQTKSVRSSKVGRTKNLYLSSTKILIANTKIPETISSKIEKAKLKKNLNMALKYSSTCFLFGTTLNLPYNIEHCYFQQNVYNTKKCK